MPHGQDAPESSGGRNEQNGRAGSRGEGAAGGAAPDGAPPADAALDRVLPAAAALYADVHRNPELSGAEARTAGRFAGWLHAAGYDVTAGVGGHGVVGVLRNGPGPVVALRAELDALPVREDTGLPYASTVTGPQPAMHACGHDMHLACVAAAADLLAQDAAGWRGALVVIGQPAEETLDGAQAMLHDGLYARFPVPEVVLAQHTVPLPAGMVAHADGPLLAAGATVEIVLHGRGGHAGTPQLAVDPVVAAASLVMRLQTVVSRETGPGEPLVLTVGSLHAGGAGNVVPDSATLQVVLRAFAEPTLDRALAAVRRMAAAEAAACGADRAPGIRVLARSGPTVNDPGAARAVRAAHEREFGPGRVARWQPSTATEDFPLLGPAGAHLHGRPDVRTVYWMLGSVGPEQWAAAVPPGASPAERLAALPANHSPRYRPHVRLTLRTGIRALTSAARAHLAAPPGSVKVAPQTPSAVEG